MNMRLAVLCLSLIANTAFANTTLSRLFSDHMVLQQQATVAVWGNDNKHQRIVIEPSWGGKYTTKAATNGRWRINIQTPSAGGPHQLKVTGSRKIEIKDVMLGEVWLASGQSNMEMPLKGFSNQPVQGSQAAILHSKNNNIRLFNVGRQYSLSPMQTLAGGDWQVAGPNTTAEFSAAAYFFAKELEQILQVPVGIITSTWGGSTLETWMSRELLLQEGFETLPEQIPAIHYLNDPNSHVHLQQIPSLLYNGMLSPLFGYKIKGAIWYQGESNIGRPDAYLKHFPKMVNEWRQRWKIGNFPFYYAQIAPYHYTNVNAAFLRDAQRLAVKAIPNSAMATTLDSNACHAIHPSNKQTIGQRLSYLALTRDYGVEGIAGAGPQFVGTAIEGSTFSIRLSAPPTGVTSFGKTVTGFELAGEDQIFHPATATIKRRQSIIELSSEAVPKPIAARYAFNNCPDYSIYSTLGLPLSSFRTDTW